MKQAPWRGTQPVSGRGRGPGQIVMVSRPTSRGGGCCHRRESRYSATSNPSAPCRAARGCRAWAVSRLRGSRASALELMAGVLDTFTLSLALARLGRCLVHAQWAAGRQAGGQAFNRAAPSYRRPREGSKRPPPTACPRGYDSGYPEYPETFATKLDPRRGGP